MGEDSSCLRPRGRYDRLNILVYIVNITKIKIKGVKLVRFIDHIGDMRNAWSTSVGKHAEMRPREAPRRRHMVNIKCITEK
jgi:hypothetical protein